MTISIYTQSLTANVDERTITGLLLPYGEQGATSAGRVTASAGTLNIPENVSEVVLNIEHDGLRPVGRATSIEEREDGLHATFRIAKTTQGNDLLEEVREGLRACLSVEVNAPVIRNGALLAGALTGAGAVVRPAFPSAGVYALTAADAGELDEETTDEVVEELETLIEKIEEEQDTEEEAEESIDTPQEETEMSASAAVPSELLTAAAKNLSGADKTADNGLSLAKATSLIANAHKTGLEGNTLTAALEDVVAGPIFDDVQQPQYIGELWNGRTFTQRFAPLVSHQPLTSRKVVGWRFTETPEVGDWAGFPNQVPTNGAATEAVEVTAQRLAGGWVLDREFIDFGETEFINAFLRHATDDYARKIDNKVLTHINSVATSVTGGTVPSGVPAGLVKVVDGALALLGDDIVPNYAIVGADLYRTILLSPKDNTFEYLSSALGLESGSLAGFSLIPSNNAALTGKVIVGAKQATTLYELPGASPVRVNALDVARGGIEEAVYGYYALLSTGKGIVKVS